MLGRMILAALVISTGVIWSEYSRSESANDPEINTQDADKSQKEKGFSIPVRILETPVDQVAKEKDWERQRRDDAHAEKNISIQEVIAKASEDVAHYTFFQTWLSAASFAGLFLTVVFSGLAWKQTRASTIEAKKSTQIAEAALAVTRENGKVQLRPYLTLDEISTNVLADGRVMIGVAIINSGQTPAFINHVKHSVNLAKKGLANPVVTNFSGKTNIVIGPDQYNTLTMSAAIAKEDVPFFAQQIASHTTVITVSMEIEYSDIFRNSHTTAFTRASDVVGGEVNFGSDLKVPDVNT